MVFEQRRAWAVAALLSFSWAGRAVAEPNAGGKETARSLMNQGDERIRANDLPGALASYQAADAIMGVPSTAVEVATTEERLGMLVEARDVALRVLRTPPRADEPRAFKLARATAERLAGDLAQRIPSIRVKVEGLRPDEVTLQLDGVTLPKAAAVVPYKVNPGKHVITASAPGYLAATATAVVAEREAAECVVALVVAPAAPPTGMGSAPRPAEHPSGSPVARSSSEAIPAAAIDPSAEARLGPAVYVGAGAAAVGFVVGTVAGVIELDRTAAARSACAAYGDDCQSRLDAAHRYATIANVAFGVAAVSTVVALVGYFGAGARGPSARAVAPASGISLSPNAVHFSGTF